jgi:DNA gyrase subunit B
MEFEKDSLRYHRVVIMTDADVDGAHIRLLLLTFFYRYQRDLISNGYVYIACPPLYRVITKGKGGKDMYLYDQVAMDAYMKTLPEGATPTIQRFKGLGEMMPNQLWETTMNPEKRSLKLVTVEDAAVADRMFSVLMGDNVVPRKDFITANAAKLSADDLDI